MPVTLGSHIYGLSGERVSDIEGLRSRCSFLARCKVPRVPGNLRETGYEAAASSLGAPMMLRNLSSSRDSSRETCIWLMPSSCAMSDCERCSK
jgi:hypothetical protein